MNLSENRVLFHQPLGGDADLYCGGRCLGRGLISKRVNIEHAAPMDRTLHNPHGSGMWMQEDHPSGVAQMFGTAAKGEGNGRRCASCQRELAGIPSKAGPV